MSSPFASTFELPKTANRTAVLIACKNGEATIANAVSSAALQADVYVVSDGSDDQTAERAREAGASVLARETSGGKPAALRAGASEFSLAERYDYIAVLDDDTALDPTYVERTTRGMDTDPRIAATSGRIDSVWNHQRRWNIPIAMRAFMYWSYQVTIKRGQNALRVVNVICGANTVFRSSVFKELIDEDAPYAIDDMYWLAEIMRRRLGRIAYVHTARSWTMDPHTLLAIGTSKRSAGHGDSSSRSVDTASAGRSAGRAVGASAFASRGSTRRTSACCSTGCPTCSSRSRCRSSPTSSAAGIDPLWFLVFFLAGSFAWICVAAIALRKPRLVVLAPALIVLDLIYRVAMMHALVKAILVPKIDVCRWDSPERFELDGQVRN